MFRAAIFSDIHGKFLLPFKLVAHYQNLTGNKIDWILQCGDMGAFPDKSRLDTATLRHARRDRDELGFLDDFAQPNPDIAAFLNQLDINMLCVRGNHEDHLFLDELEATAAQHNQAMFAIDAYKRVHVCRSGMPVVLDNGAEQLNLVGVGRIGDRKRRDHPQFIQEYEHKALKKLYKTKLEFDVLLTHDKPSESERGFGSQEVADLLNHVPFAWHFYGHTGEPFAQAQYDNGITQSVKIKELEFNHEGKLEAGCMLILEKQDKDIQISPVPLCDIIGFMHQTWRYM